MKFKDDECETRQGETPACWVTNSKDLEKIQEHLFFMVQGFKFAIIFDTTKDEYEELADMPVYFLDCLVDEMIEYVGVDTMEKAIAEYKEKNTK